MKVVLLKDIKDIGKQYEIKEVKEGYARNFLIPKELAKPATPEIVKWAEVQKELCVKKSEEELKVLQEIVSNIEGQEIVISVKVGEERQLFEKISSQKISDQLKEAGFEVKKNQIVLEEPIKDLGEYPIKIKFEHGLEAEIKLIVSEEKER